MARQDGPSLKGTTHWKKLTVQELQSQGPMEAGGLKASLIQRFSNETLQQRSDPSENGAVISSKQPGLGIRGIELAEKNPQAGQGEKFAPLIGIGDGKNFAVKPTEINIQSSGVKASIDLRQGGLSSAVPSTDLGRKQRRAERFGMSVQLSEDEKRKARAVRFGGFSTPTLEAISLDEGLRKSEEDKKRKARAERFGLPLHSSTDEEEKRKARSVRFGVGTKYDYIEEEKREARAVRFGLLSDSSVSEVNKKVKTVPTGALASA